jgi:large subunit ribosomal protein L2
MLIFLKINKPFKFLSFKKKTRLNGRGFGLILNRHRGGGVKIKYRIIDFYRNLWNISAISLTVEYNPVNKKLLSLIFYFNGIFAYITHIKGLHVGSVINASNRVKLNLGNAFCIEYMPYGTYVHNVELYPRRGAQYARSPGSYCKILNKYSHFIKVKLCSGKKIFLLQTCMATIGVISDFIYLYYNYNINAGYNRRIG